MEPEDEWVLVNNIPTRVHTWGGTVKNSDNLVPGNNSIILLLTGNPGVTDFYDTFLGEIYNQLAIPVWAICHAGHENPSRIDPNKEGAFTEYDEKVYNVEEQIAHKAQFIRQYIPAERQIFIIAHSFGAKLTVELLKLPEFRKRISKCYLLFPTLERIKDTPNGKFLYPMFTDYLFSTIIFLSWVFTVFPMGMRSWLIRTYFMVVGHRSIDKNCIKAVVQLIQPLALRNVFLLARDEMFKIRELDKQTITECTDKLKVYFGASDGWAPLEYQESLKEAVPSIDSSTLDERFEHAFVLESAEQMAQILVDQIKKNMT